MSFNWLSFANTKKARYDIPKPDITFAPKAVSPQSFPYPLSLINYAKRNPSTPKLCIKLLKSCKYFYSKKNLLIPLTFYSRYQIWNTISTKKEIIKNKLPFNIWLIKSIHFSSSIFIFDSYFLKSATRCNIKKLYISNQNISFKDFEFLINNGVITFECRSSSILHSNGLAVPIEVIFEKLRNIENLYYTFDKETAKLVTPATAQKLIEIIDASKLKNFYFEMIPPSFNLKTLRKFAAAHTNVQYRITLSQNF